MAMLACISLKVYWTCLSLDCCHQTPSLVCCPIGSERHQPHPNLLAGAMTGPGDWCSGVYLLLLADWNLS